MKALSVRQPWVHAILHLGKRIENRKWYCHYRGPLLLHVGGSVGLGEYEDAVDGMLAMGVIRSPSEVPPRDALPRGGLIARARVVACLRPTEGTAARTGSNVYTQTRARPNVNGGSWHVPWCFGIVLADVAPLPAFVPYKGCLGLFNVPDAALSVHDRPTTPLLGAPEGA